MPSLKQLTKKIASLKSTVKITKAMKMIAATKLNRAQNNAMQSKPYTKKVSAMLSRLAASERDASVLFHERKNVKNICIILISSDRGLCGGFNSNLFKKILPVVQDGLSKGKSFTSVALGRKGWEFLKRRDIAVTKYYEGMMRAPRFSVAGEVGRAVAEEYRHQHIDEAWLVYNRFKSVLTQEAVIERILPISAEAVKTEKSAEASVPYLFEPDRQRLVRELSAKSIEIAIWDAILSSVAGEHAARMNAMENATKNGKELINKNTIKRNRIRQAMITTELTEIISGAESI